MMRQKSGSKTATVILAIVAVAVTVTALVISATRAEGAAARSNLSIIAGAATGGGWDTTARAIQQVSRANGIVNNTQVVNIPGAGGTIALGSLVDSQGEENRLLITGGGMIASAVIARSGVGIEDVTPIARMTEEYSVLTVPAESPYQTMEEFAAAWKQDPSSIAVGGSSIGNTDHLLASRSALALGIDAKEEMKYIPFEGGGELLNALLSRSVDAGVTGYKEIQDQVEAGNLRVLGISSPERDPDLDFPTFQEGGIDVVAANWRGVVAPPGITEQQRQELIDIVTEVHESPEWKEITARNSWTDTFLAGDEFDAFVDEELATAEDIVERLGL